jgi:hypothetical protein
MEGDLEKSAVLSYKTGLLNLMPQGTGGNSARAL